MVQKFLPSGPLKSTMNYEIYRNKHSSEEDFHLISSMYARVMAEDKVLCDQAQKNLNVGVFVNGQLHPKYEKAPLFFQETVREQAEGKQIWPARRDVEDEVSRHDIEICEGISCGEKKEALVW
jgi:hypothetical protein